MYTLLWLLTAFSLMQDSPGLKQAERIYASGEKLYSNGKYQNAADTFAIAASLYDRLKKPVDRVRSLNLQAECLSNLGQCDHARTLLDQSLAIITTQNDKRVLAETYYYLSRHIGGCARKFDESVRIMQVSIDIKKTIFRPDDPVFALDYTFLGYVYNSKGKYDSALLYLNQAMSIREKHLKDDDIELSHTLFNLSASYEGKSDLAKALSLNQRSYNIRLKELGAENATISNNINSIGRIYRKLGNHERALEYYREALEIRKSTLGATHPNVAASYYEIGNLYGTISNYHAALEFVQQGNRILESNTQVTNDVLPSYIAYAGKMYGLIGQHENAKAHIQKGVALAEKVLASTHPYRAICYNMAAEYYGDAGDLAQQSVFAKKAIDIYRASYGAGSEREADVIAKLAASNAKLGRTEESKKLYADALKYYSAKLGADNPKITSTYLGMGDYEKAFASCDPNNKPLMLKIVKGRAATESIEAAFASFNNALKLTEEISKDYNNEAARLQLEKDRRELYEAAMNTAWQLYEKSNNQSILEQAFSLAEKSKATLLLENMRDRQAKTMAGVPDSLVDKERDIRIGLAYFKNQLYQATRKNDTASLRTLEKSIFDTERDLETFKTKMGRDFPAYYKLKFSEQPVDLAAIRKDNSTVLQYFVSSDAIYCFIVSKNSTAFRRTPYGFASIVDDYQKSLTDTRFILNDPKTADSLYSSSAKALFKLLMIPDTQDKRLVIVPDDFLGHFNFGVLLSGDGQYLNEKHVISYAYSSAFINQSHKKSRGDNFAGFAPSYEQKDYSTVDSTEHPMVALAMRSGNLPLPGAAAEVNLISKMMSGESWLDEEASETNFKTNAGNYDVLHLAMHSLLNDEEPRYSELLFNNRKDTDNDGYLTVAEIYNLKLDAQLVVLSSCSSGFGKIQRGEGPISLSRAFSYAGCPSVVMSLWKVPDQVTTGIMKNFYESLRDGLHKDEALRAAQKKFLAENTDPVYKHPYYWAGFVVIGDTSPLETGSYLFYYLGGIAAVVALGALVLVRRK